jgi:phosphoadenosine phosphosulfate reductase
VSAAREDVLAGERAFDAGATVPASAPRAAAPADLAAVNAALASRSAEARVEWALEHLPGAHVISSSFGAQAAVMLHLGTRLQRLPIVLIDTGHLFPETYRFADELAQRLDLDLRVYGPERSAEWLEARHGRLWEQGVEGIERYNELHKIEPMRRALAELAAGTWYSGLRRSQSRSRAEVEFVSTREGRYEVHPIADWTDRDVWVYLKKHGLPYHPLWDQGYVSIGDRHTTRTLAEAGGDEEATRFNGLKRECGLHGLEG